jgi:putative nucleotidyltransferase with HDIG domain
MSIIETCLLSALLIWKNMTLRTDPQITRIFDAIHAELRHEQPLYLVGGSVRDDMLGGTINDLDFVMPEDPTRLAKEVARRLKAGFFVLDDERRTTRILFKDLEGKNFPLDFVKYTGNSLLEDLRSRDFTINAMALSIHDLSTLVDPLGGREDLNHGRLILCHPGALMADPVRVLRGIRMTLQFGLDFEPDMESQMQQAAAQLPATSYERQRDEFFKILAGPEPAQGMVYCRQFKVFETLFPNLVDQESIPASPPHVFPLFDHTNKVIEYLDQLLGAIQMASQSVVDRSWWLAKASDVLLPYAVHLASFFQEEVTPERRKCSLALLGALLHDLGKPMTMKMGEDGRLHYYNHAQVGADLALEATKRLKLSNAECNWVSTLVRHHMDLLPLINGQTPLTPKVIYRFYQKVDEVGITIVLHTLADTLATYDDTLTAQKWEQTLMIVKAFVSAWWDQKETLISPTPILDGYDLQRIFGLEPGQQIGTLLDSLIEAQAIGEVSTQAEAKSFILKTMKSI